MAGTSLLALIDDIAAIMDDVAMMSKVAAKKTAGVVGDDLAVSADQVNGVKPERELPIIWNIAKGSMKNKAILIPAALGISAVAPGVIPILLIAGGTYLVYEGGEKIVEKLFHKEHQNQSENALEKKHLTKEEHDKIEKEKISGAIKTDLVLSGEIIVIALGTMASAPLATQALALSGIGVALTVGVYGVVAGIVKADDIGLHLMNKENSPIQNWIGEKLVNGMPKFMKTLSIVGTAAMFTVGGGILAHNIPGVHHLIEMLPQAITSSGIGVMAVEAAVGVLGGFAAVGAMHFKEPIVSAFNPVINFVKKIKNKYYQTEDFKNEVELKKSNSLEDIRVEPTYKESESVEKEVKKEIGLSEDLASRLTTFQSIVEEKSALEENKNLSEDDELEKGGVMARLKTMKSSEDGDKSYSMKYK